MPVTPQRGYDGQPEEPDLTIAQTVGYLTLGAIWFLWLISLPMSFFLWFAFDDEVSDREGLILGSIQATWIAGIPVALLFVRQIAGHGWGFPRWQARWLLVLVCAIAWIGIVVMWIQAAAGCNTCY